MTDLGKTQDYRVLKEKVEILFGQRGDKRMAAMRAGDAIDLREFIAALRKGTADVQRDLKDAEASLETLANSLSTTQSNLADTNSALASAQSTLGTLAGNVASLQADIETAQDAIDTLGDSGALISARVDDIQSAVGAVPVPTLTSADAAAAPTMGEHNALRADVVALTSALASLISAISS